MKQTPLIFLLLVLLTACATPTPSSTMIVTVSPSASPAPSATVTKTPLPTFTPTPPPVEYNQLAPETMGCLKPDMCMGLEVKDKESAYQAIVDAFANSYENRAWMSAMGLKSTEDFHNFLQNSTHVDPATGEERTHWVPLTAPNGATFKILQGTGNVGGSAFFSDKTPAIVEQGGFWLDGVGFVAASKTEIDTNAGGVADWLNTMWEQNGKNVLLRSSSVRVEEWGLVIVGGRVVFVSINNATPQEGNKNNHMVLGQVNSVQDAKIVSAELALFLRASVEYGNNRTETDITNAIVKDGVPQLESDPSLWVTAPSLCVAGYDCLGNIHSAPAWIVSQDASAQ